MEPADVLAGDEPLPADELLEEDEEEEEECGAVPMVHR